MNIVITTAPPPKKKLPDDITSYDLAKTFAVLSMISDHVGFYIYPNEIWWRVVGRLCVPIWFFLIGYARSRDTGWRMWAGMFVLLAGNVIAGMSLLPVNILGTMLVIRYSLDRIMAVALQSRVALWSMSATLFIMMIPTIFLWEYGTQAIVMAMAGYIMRHRQHLRNPDKVVNQFFAMATASFIGIQWVMFGFSKPEGLALTAGIIVVMGALSVFWPETFPRLTAALPRPVVAFFHIFGRHTLFIYVAHLLVLKALGLYLEPARFVLFHWKIFSPTGV